MAAAASGTPPLGKYLASTDKKTRDKAIKGLATFLSDPSRDGLPKSEMAKLWKGIFYCFWMSDKPLVQQALASELAEILLSISTISSSLSFLRGFWEAVVREWSGIDRLRLDKYYMLIRRFVNASFRLLIRSRWDIDACNQYNDILTERGGPLCPDDTRVPSSLTYHLADIYTEELDKALANSPSPSPLPAPLITLLTPFFTLAARTPTNITFQRIQSAFLEPLIDALRVHSDEDDRPKSTLLHPAYDSLIANSCLTDPSEGALELNQLRNGLLRAMFNAASHQDSRDSNRRKLYALWKSNIEEEDSFSTLPLDAS